MSERIQIMLINLFLWGAVFPVMFLGSLWMLGSIVDGAAERMQQKAICEKHAMSYYEGKQCH